MRTTLSLFVLAVVAAAFGAGCTSRELVGFADHDSKKLTSMRVLVRKNYLFSSSVEAVVYSCAEVGDKLDCKRICGGSTDTTCPTAVVTSGGASSNIR